MAVTAWYEPPNGAAKERVELATIRSRSTTTKTMGASGALTLERKTSLSLSKCSAP